MNKSAVLFGLFLTALLISGCNSEQPKPEDLIAENNYIDLLVEFHLLRSYQEFESVNSSKADSLMETIFEKYDVTQEQFLRSQKYYQRDFQNHSSQLEEAVERLRKDRLQQDSTDVSDSTETVNQ